MPQPADISPGTGMSLPGMPFSMQYLSNPMASVVVWKVIILFSDLSFIISSALQRSLSRLSQPDPLHQKY